MKLYLLSIGYLFGASILLTCRQSDPEPDRLLDGTPRLKSIAFTGIPQENISIDQKTKIVSIKVPPIVLDKVGIAVETTDNAEWLNKTDYISAAVLGCNPCYQIILKDKKDIYNSLDKGIYIIQTIASAPLKVALLPAALTYVIKDNKDNLSTYSIAIPMVNLYGNTLPKEAYLTHDTTGENLIIKRDSSGSYFFGVHYSSLANRLGIYLYDEKLMPGSYHIRLILDDGTFLKIMQPLLVTKGSVSFDYNGLFGYRVPMAKTFTIKGYNLFEGDISFDLVDQQGQTHLLQDIIFERYGRQIQVSVPPLLTVGQYILRVYIKGVKQPNCLRVNILKDDKERPFIGTLVNQTDAESCSLFDPVMVQRGIALFFTSNQVKSALDKLAQHVNLKLVSLASGAFYYASVVPYDYANSGFPGSFTVPTIIPSGLYTATLQVLDAQNNVIDESEPYGRILDVK